MKKTEKGNDEMDQLVQKLIKEHGYKEMRTKKDLEDYIGEGDEAQFFALRRCNSLYDFFRRNRWEKKTYTTGKTF